MSAESPRIRNNDPRDKDPDLKKDPAAEWNEIRDKELLQERGELPPDSSKKQPYASAFADPEIKETLSRINTLTNEAETDAERDAIHEQQWGAYAKVHPEKTVAYKKELGPLHDAVDAEEKRQESIVEKIHAEIPTTGLASDGERIKGVWRRLKANASEAPKTPPQVVFATAETTPTDEATAEAPKITAETPEAAVKTAESVRTPESNESREAAPNPEKKEDHKAKGPVTHQKGGAHIKHEKGHGGHGHGHESKPVTTKDKILGFGIVGAGAAVLGAGALLESVEIAHFVGLTPLVVSSLAGIGLGGGIALAFGSFFALYLLRNIAVETWAELKKQPWGKMVTDTFKAGSKGKGGKSGGGAAAHAPAAH